MNDQTLRTCFIYVCNGQDEPDNYKVVKGECFYKDKAVGRIGMKTNITGIDIYYQPYEPITSLRFEGFILNNEENGINRNKDE